MEFFKKAKAVRFRSHHEKYLLAGDDEESIWQDRDGYVRNARWTVEMNESGTAIRLKSCYGKYLTASNVTGRLGMKSKKVVQTLPKTLDSTVEWEPIREGFKVKLKMKGTHGQFLRANGGVPLWRNSITHDTAHRKMAKEWILWNVDVVEIARQKKMRPDNGGDGDDPEQWDSCLSSSEIDDMTSSVIKEVYESIDMTSLSRKQNSESIDVTSLLTKQNSESEKSEVCGDPQPLDSEIDMTALPAKQHSDGKKQRKTRRGGARTNPISMFTMCTCSPPVNDKKGSIVKKKKDKKNHKKGSKPS